MKVLLSTTYFGPVQWYQKLCGYDEVLIERHDSYRKQTYRNRCLIATTNGVQALTVPVEHTKGDSIVRISDHGNWRHQHWQAITSAYGDSPFFQFYEDDLRPFFTERWELLHDYNEAIRQKICELMDIHPKVSFTDHFIDINEVSAEGAMTDFRDSIDPKHLQENHSFTPRRYYQVYESKLGFLSNLSILDLLLNMGPESIFYLVQNSINPLKNQKDEKD